MSANKYHTRFLESYSAENLVALFSRYKKSAKEVTESYAMVVAYREYLTRNDTVCVVVGDGGSPRTGAFLAYYTNAKVISIDPNMNMTHWAEHKNKQAKMGFPVKNLTVVQGNVEDFSIQLKEHQHCCLVYPHSHADMRRIQVVGTKSVSCISMPCCVPIPDTLMRIPHVTYSDQHVISPKRVIHIWNYSSSDELLAAHVRCAASRGVIVPDGKDISGIPTNEPESQHLLCDAC